MNVVRNRPDINDLKEELKSLGADEVLTEEEVGKLTIVFGAAPVCLVRKGITRHERNSSSVELCRWTEQLDAGENTGRKRIHGHLRRHVQTAGADAYGLIHLQRHHSKRHADI